MADAASRISVVIPCYNAASYVAEAIRSVLQQTEQCAVHEVVIVDDGSTDNSADVARAVPSEVTVRIIVQQNSGISEARNAGIRASSGDWLAFLDADDIWPSDSLYSRAALLQRRSDLSAVSGKIEQFISPDADAETRANVQLPPEPMHGRLIGAMLVRRRAFDDVGYFSRDYTVGETLDWVGRFEAAGHRIGSVDAVVLRRRIHNNNSMRKQEQLKADYLSVLRAAIARKRHATAPTMDGNA